MGRVLVSKSVAEIVTFWRPGSHDTADTPDGANRAWTWADEYAYCIDGEDANRTARIDERVRSEGITFADETYPVMLGNDGRVWDGHHRICLAIKYQTPYLACDVVPTPDTPPAETGTNQEDR